MTNEVLVYKTNSLDPWFNLAVEEYLLDTVGENQYMLYLWQNRDTIVIGKNQNPWKECRSALLEKDGGYLARRLSGGGTVFHDLGNLNFTFLASRKNYNLEKQVGVILAAVKKLGIPAEMTGRNDLTADGRKFSGNAFCFRKNSAYHHGTILVSSDFEKLTKYLNVPQEKIHAKGISSVRSRVVNLTEFSPEITIEKMKEALVEEFARAYGTGACEVRSTDGLDRDAITRLYKKYASWEWRYGEVPQFDIEISTRFQWGGIDISFKLEKGLITEATVYSDAMDEEFIGFLPQVFKGARLSSAVLSKLVGDMELSSERKFMKDDISAWLAGKEL